VSGLRISVGCKGNSDLLAGRTRRSRLLTRV
jgi:hypothetical protein